MLFVLVISAFIFALILLIAIIKGWFLFPAIWLSCICLSVFIGWFAVAFIKPRYPEWWERNIATENLPDA